MASALFQLPSDVVGSNVLTMLSCVDIIHLDTAACSFSSRRDLTRLFTMAPNIDLRNPRDLIDPERFSTDPDTWKWFWKRHLIIKGIEAANDQEVAFINQNIHFVNGPLSIYFGEVYSFNAKGRLSQFPLVIEKMNRLSFNSQVKYINEVVEAIPRMTNLTSIVSHSTNLSKDDIVQLIHPQLLLKELKLNSNVGSRLLNAILPMGLTLRSLVFKTSTLQEVHYKLIAQHCPHLHTFHLTELNKMSVPHSGVAAIAMNCQKLRDVKISATYVGDEAMPLLFATHCPELRKVEFRGHANLTDATLNALVHYCPHLEEIVAEWNVVSAQTVIHASALLARLKKFWAAGMHLLARDTLPLAVQHLRDVEAFDVATSFQFLDETVLLVVSPRCTQLRKFRLHMPSTSALPLKSAISLLAQNNPHLEVLQLILDGGGAGLSDATLAVIATCCPHLRSFTCLPRNNTLTDASVLKLAQGCPKLHHFNCSGPGITNASVVALGKHCRYLCGVDLTHCTKVTEAAVDEHLLKPARARYRRLSVAKPTVWIEAEKSTLLWWIFAFSICVVGVLVAYGLVKLAEECPFFILPVWGGCAMLMTLVYLRW